MLPACWLMASEPVCARVCVCVCMLLQEDLSIAIENTFGGLTLNGNCGHMQPNHSAEARKAPLCRGEAELSPNPRSLRCEGRGLWAEESTRRGLVPAGGIPGD